jgi:putative inorganic carbon (hco3(-)) transporter
VTGFSLSEKAKTWWLYGICLAFVAVNIYMVMRDMYWTLLIPLGLVLLYTYINHLDRILLLITLLTPVAINLTNQDFGIGVSMPTEPLMFGVLVLFIIQLFYGRKYDREILKHPVSVIILFDLLWILITSFTSQLPVVSIKFFIARLWFVIPFYFLGVLLFRKVLNMRLFIWFYVLPLLVVIGYTIYNHYLWGFEEQAGHWVMEPFYNDHTAYGAMLTFFIPVMVGFTFFKGYSRITRLISFVVLVILLIALVLSFSRAAWVSLAFALLVYMVVLFRIKFKYILLTLFIMAGLFYLFQNEIWDRLERNKQGTSANFVEHIQSISNISTDNSNLERINRWQSAFRMFAERPVFGYGPGTYQFEYGPFQHSTEKTLISTNFGDRGNAHSEYIGPLAEQGVIGSMTILGILILTMVYGLRIHRRIKNREMKMLSLAVTLGLLTYFFHGTMNNFLDTDKASVPFWGFIAILTAMDLYFLRPEEKEAKDEMNIEY